MIFVLQFKIFNFHGEILKHDLEHLKFEIFDPILPPEMSEFISFML
jgi:hypothetical protein